MLDNNGNHNDQDTDANKEHEIYNCNMHTSKSAARNHDTVLSWLNMNASLPAFR